MRLEAVLNSEDKWWSRYAKQAHVSGAEARTLDFWKPCYGVRLGRLRAVVSPLFTSTIA